MSTFHATAIVLRREDWRDAARFYAVYTREHGKLFAVGRGTRKPLSKLGAHLEPYSLVELHLARGRRMDTICGAVLARPPEPLAADPDRHLVAAFVAETVDHFVKPGEPDAALWELVDGTLRAAAAEPVRTLPALAAAFAWRLMDRLGYHPRLERCVSCEDELESGLFLPVRGAMLCAACRPSERDLAGAEPLDAAALAAVRACLGTGARPITDRAASAGLALLEVHLDGPIATMPLVRQVLNSRLETATVPA